MRQFQSGNSCLTERLLEKTNELPNGRLTECFKKGIVKELDMIVKRLGKGVMLCMLFTCLLTFVGNSDGTQKHVTIAILPCRDVAMVFMKFNPLATYLRQETGLDIRLVVPKDSMAFEKDVINDDIDFAFQDPYTYVRMAKLYNRDALLRGLTRDGEKVQSGVVIARKDSGTNTVEDLKGKTVMFGPKLSATTWVVAKLLFEQRGINIDKDLRAYSNGKCCEDIAFNVYIKAVDAGVVCDHFLEEHSERHQELGINPKDIIVIGRTKLIPTNVFAANRNVNKDVIAVISQALLRLEKEKQEHKKILYPAELGGFEKSRDEDYDDVRMLIEES
jgi:phosphate/phosphite/phosphonate ABC transporter binding protein